MLLHSAERHGNDLMNTETSQKLMRSYLKNLKYVIMIGLLLLIPIYISTFAAPKIYLTTSIQNVTEKDFVIFLKHSDLPIEKKNRNNCRYISVQLKAVKPILLVKDLRIEKLSLRDYLNETQNLNNQTEKVQYLGGYYSEGISMFFDGTDVYLEDMNDEKLRRVFDDYKIKVTWVNLFDQENTKIFYLKDYWK